MNARPTLARSAAPWLALILLAVIPYAASIASPLLYDDRTLLDNPWLAHEAGPSSVFLHDFWFGSRHEGSDLYRPMTILSLAWNLRLTQGAAGIRGVNLVLHAIVVLLAACLLHATLRRARPAWTGAALFAVHPLASESVLWAVGRAELLAAAFGLAAFLLILDSRRRTPLRLACAAALFSAALCSKESAASWILIVSLWAWLDRPEVPAPRRWAPSACFALVLLAFLGVRSFAIGSPATPPPFLDNPLVAASVPARIANAVLLHARYLAKMLLPLRLSIDYGFDQIRVVTAWPFGMAAAAAIAAAWLLVFRRLRRAFAALAFLWAFTAAAFAVTANLIVPIGTIFAERLAYLPLLGACGLGGVALSAIASTRLRGIVSVVLIATLAMRTGLRAADYRSLVALTEATASASPRSVKALLNLGRVRLEIQNRPAEAIPPLERALSIRPDTERAQRLLAKAREATRPE